MSKIIVLGGGESGVGAALLAKSKGFDVFLSDQGTLKEAFKKTLSDNHIRFEEGQHTLDEILSANEVIISPGIPEKNEVVKKIKEKNIPLISEIEFAFRYTSAKIIAITGSNGKTTTTLLIYHLLKEAGYCVGLAGNIGQSFAKQVLENSHDYYVIEMSSFQLDRCISFNPDIAILLNITPDHMDRYEYKFENYVASKFRIFQNADLAKTCIFWEDDEVIQSNKHLIPSSNFSTISSKNNHSDAYISANEIKFQTGIIDLTSAPIQGPHNAINMSAAILAAQAVGISLDKIKELLPSFHNAPHRLEPCGLSNGIRFVNDSKATNVDAVYYALNSFSQPIILMMGGVDKGNEYEVLDKLMQEKVKGLICLGKDNKKLMAHFSGFCHLIFSTDDLNAAVQKGIEWGSEGDIILLSPACASFDLFKNYEDRGDQFKHIVKLLTHGN